jgi:O-antigen/teichoic acid export membrane protein
VTLRATRDGLLVVGGRISFVALWFGAVLLVYRGLGEDEAGLAQAGVFAVAMAINRVASGCIVDSGDVALMRRAPLLLRDDPQAAFRLLWAAFALRLGAVGIATAGLITFAAVAATGGVAAHSILPLMGYVAAAILADAIFRSVMVVLQAQERFPTLVLLEGCLQVARLSAILLLWLTDAITVSHVLAAYVGVAFLVGLGGAALLLPRGMPGAFAVKRDDITEMLHALKWLVPGMLVGVLSDRLDVMLVFAFGEADDAGRYGAMATLALMPDIVAGSLAALLQPRIARMRLEGTYTANLRLFLRISLAGALAAYVVALVIAEPVIGLMLGDGYLPGVPAFLVLLAGTLFWLAVTPLPLAMVGVHAPKRIAMVALGQSALIVAIGLPLFWLYGKVGMAIGVCATRVAVALALVAMARRLILPPDRAGEAQCASL